MNIESFRRLLKYCFILIVSLCFCGSSAGQEQKVVRDLGLWTEIKLEKEVINNLEIFFSQHLRLHKNMTGFDDYISEAGLDYKINSNFDIGAAGRYTRNNHFDNLAENDYRYDLYFSYDTNISEKLKIFARAKYQKEFYRSGVFNEFLHYFETTYRYRMKLEFAKDEKHAFYGSAEFFRLAKKSREPFWDKYRIWLGDEIAGGFGDFDLAWGIEHELNAMNPYTYFILKVNYTIEL
ncbi:Protein of unknown function [Tangfeifania diversioriginum]|uniref:DUF2490 domain-containing protein n=1 Tax=Tangfeifania diversioriginum TaxID=1168035 RepID=A0A1M6L3T7_9BACT|nr:DUF2490 domain-containing protein [Tangfeifania diversioriginum]SHJ65823.1 Protein of unknown function [Tangfeifania diversioriginum]